MKVIVVGLGSMGKRRIRLLKKISTDIRIVGVDTNSQRTDFAKEEYGIEVFTDLAEALTNSGAECAVISTAPVSHAKIINQCLKAGVHVFTELNLVSDMYDENMQLAEEKGLTLFLSSTFLYRDEIEYIIDSVEKTPSNVNYSYHIGQYLPDWHPWENIKDFFVNDKRTNGCREIFAIEMPWLTKAFGEVTSLRVIKSKNTSLPVDYMDNYLLLLEHKSGHKGMLAVDVMSRKAVRNLEVFGEDIYLSWDGSPTGLYKYDYDSKNNVNVQLYDEVDTIEGYSAFVIENAYQRELEAFLAIVKGEGSARYSFSEDKDILQLIDHIEEP